MAATAAASDSEHTGGTNRVQAVGTKPRLPGSVPTGTISDTFRFSPPEVPRKWHDPRRPQRNSNDVSPCQWGYEASN